MRERLLFRGLFCEKFLLLLFCFSHITHTYLHTKKERDLRERGGEKKSSQKKKKNTRRSFISRDFLIESERIRRFRREEQKSLTHSFVFV